MRSQKDRQPNGLHINSSRSGFGLLESMIAVLLTSLLMVSALRSLGASKRREFDTSDQIRAQQIAADLLNEILRQSYQEPVSTPSFGLESGESNGNRSLFDDVDDYRNWTSTPPKDRNGIAIPGLAGWTQSVAVFWADSTTLLPSSNSNTGLKKITVTLTKSNIAIARMTAYRSSAWVDTIPKPTDETGNHAPIAIATGSPLTAKANVARTFLGSSSSDQDQDPLTYVWSFGDGATASGASVSHRYNSIGTYTCTLTVYDGRGGTGVSALTVSVVP